MTAPILVATDFSAIADAALQHAIALARLHSTSIRLVHVVEAVAPSAPHLGLPENIESRITDRVATLLAEREQQIAEQGIEVETRSKRGVAADCILAEATEASTIVLGTHGYGGFRQFFVGSVATRVLRGAPCPVLVVPPDAPPPPWTTLLFPADLSPLCTELFGEASQLAQQLGAVLEIFHVEIPRDTALMAYGLGDALVYELSTERAQVEAALAALSAKARHLGVTTTVGRTIAHGPGRAIAKHAAQGDTRLIVMPSHGRRGFQRFVHGSVTEAVLRHTQCALLVLPTKLALPA